MISVPKRVIVVGSTHNNVDVQLLSVAILAQGLNGTDLASASVRPLGAGEPRPSQSF